jgi:hypothetical protein
VKADGKACNFGFFQPDDKLLVDDVKHLVKQCILDLLVGQRVQKPDYLERSVRGSQIVL